MKATTKRALWIGGLLGGAVLAVAGVAMATSKPATPTAPPTPPESKTLDLAAGPSRAQISKGDGLTLVLPTGALFSTNITVDGQIPAADATGTSGYSFGMGMLAPGDHTIMGFFSPAAGAPQQAFSVQVTVTP